MAWPVNAVEMTARARTPGAARSVRRPGPRWGRRSIARPSRARAGSTSATSSCSPLPAGCASRTGPGRATRGARRGGGAHRAPPGSARSRRPRATARAAAPRRAVPRRRPAPRWTMTTRSARRSASSKEWVVTTTRRTRPRAVSRTRSHTSRRACGSRPAVGSSRKATWGRPSEGGGERHPLSLAAGDPADGRARRTPRCPSRATRSSSGGGRGVQGGEVAQQRTAARPLVAARRPGASPRPGPGGRRRRARGRAAGRGTDPPSGRCSPSSALDRGGLAGAVRAEEGGDLPGRGRPRHAVDRAMGAETAHEPCTVTAWSTPRSLGRPRG